MSSSKSDDSCYAYMVQCKYGTYYAGWTNDVDKRMAVHHSGKGAKYLRGRGPIKLVYKEKCATAKEAQDKEREIKKLSREEKEILVQSYKSGQR
jgi:putative endonuclease